MSVDRKSRFSRREFLVLAGGDSFCSDLGGMYTFTPYRGYSYASD